MADTTHLRNIAKALSDENRLSILTSLISCGELCTCNFAEDLGVSAPTISRHMEVLLRAKLVEARKDGRWVHYKLSENIPGSLMKWLLESLEIPAERLKDKSCQNSKC